MKLSIRRATVVVMVAGLAASVAAFTVTRHVVSRDERRLEEQETVLTASALGAFLSQVRTGLDSAGAVAAVTDGDQEAFARFADTPGASFYGTLVLMVRSEGRWVPKATVGEVTTPLEDETPIGNRLQTMRSAGFEFLGFDGEGFGRRLAMANRPSFTDDYMIYAEVPLPEGATFETEGDGDSSSFDHLNFALYLGAETEDALVFSSTEELPLTGSRTATIIVSDDASTAEYDVLPDAGAGSIVADPGDLIVITSPVGPITGTVARWLPWLLLALSLVSVAAVAFIIEVVQRRRDDALRLVGDLEAKNAALDRALTSEQAAQEELAASRERFERIIAGSPDVLISVDAETKAMVLLNRDDFFGYPVEHISRDGAFRALVHEDDLDGYDEFLERIRLAGLDDVVESTFRLRTASGDQEWIRARVKLIEETPDGEPFRILAILTVATPEREAQEAQARLHEQLRQAQRLEAIGQLAGGIAHDFNNLLAVILSYSGFVAHDLGDEHPARADVDEITKAARRAAELTGQLLTFSRKQVVDPSVLCLNDVVAPMEKILERTLGENIDLSVRLASGLAPVESDAGEIEQILMNLVVNARDAIDSDHGTLVIETADVLLDERYAEQHPDVQPGEYACLSVSDSGRGMEPDVAAHAFEPFFTTKGPDKGTGMGLATVYGIVRRWGGATTIYSEPGHGTTVRAYLPVADTAPSTKRAKAAEQPERAQGETVLVVEDEAGVRQAARRILERGGYTVLEAATGTDALDRYRTVHLDLLLTDVVMPGGCSGRDLAQEFELDMPGLPVVYMSGYTADVVAHQGVLEAGTTLVQKPFTEVALLTAVADVLHGTAVGGVR